MVNVMFGNTIQVRMPWRQNTQTDKDTEAGDVGPGEAEEEECEEETGEGKEVEEKKAISKAKEVELKRSSITEIDNSNVGDVKSSALRSTGQRKDTVEDKGNIPVKYQAY